ncbi:Unknown protein, partial [Striga hermonthica]
SLIKHMLKPPHAQTPSAASYASRAYHLRAPPRHSYSSLRAVTRALTPHAASFARARHPPTPPCACVPSALASPNPPMSRAPPASSHSRASAHAPHLPTFSRVLCRAPAPVHARPWRLILSPHEPRTSLLPSQSRPPTAFPRSPAHPSILRPRSPRRTRVRGLFAHSCASNGGVRDYQKEFERLACRVRGWPESVLVGAFAGGLRYDLAAEVRLERTETMHKAMEVARRREDHLAVTRRGRADFRVPEPRRVPATVGAPSANARPPGTFRPPATEVKRLTEEEMSRRREKRLCFRCEEKYTPGHRCKQNYLIEFVDSDDEEPVIEEEREVEVLNDEVEISIHAMAGTKGPRTMKLPAWLKDRRVTVLVDNGSSHNFINATLSHKLKLPMTTIEPFEVRVANGERLRCSKMYRGVPIKFQGVMVKADLFALPLVGPDVVLGVQWLEGLGDVTTNYRKGVMKFEAGDQLVTLKASEGATKGVGLKNIEK